MVDRDRVVGMVTDRDIVVRAVAAGRCPLSLNAADLMSKPVVVIGSDDSIDRVVKTLEENQVRRAPVVDGLGLLVGIVSQSDVALQAPKNLVAEMVTRVSQGIDLGHT